MVENPYSIVSFPQGILSFLEQHYDLHFDTIYIYISTYFSLLLYHDDRIQLQPFVKGMGQVMVPKRDGLLLNTDQLICGSQGA